MFQLPDLPHSLQLMGFRSAFVVPFWSASVTVPEEHAAHLQHAIDTVAEMLPRLRLSGYFFNENAHLTYQINRVPGPANEVLSDQELKEQLATLEALLVRQAIPCTTRYYTRPPQDEQICILFGLGKGFSGVHFSREQVWQVLQRHHAGEGGYQHVRIYATGGGEATYEEPALLIPSPTEADFHWICMSLLVFWQEWATVYDKEQARAYRLVTTLEDVREALYTKQEAASL
ncbi:hypothetical protein EI42_04794 [Thermosporothrix hazakensis]|jgi:hypothetical protein|uniref:Uncharacterized protein n=2 Tax=Thermosporothrix TaxID=768650 RepID=A0A326U2B3_THEHA|nr:hypothetical protein [Thermosporothrix hazakensis]PZW24103.1 hypothetical protein EI42_04794 [Thermosporothrix hazakensis]BBH87891.1 hypothetical protein KTC_26420 [Thermosporothrix sp. COM3]GCE50315.1 hypothetical protein KTH_51840 [Thermosporothrix hazakensis]